jgi:hypothetical protein
MIAAARASASLSTGASDCGATQDLSCSNQSVMA